MSVASFAFSQAGIKALQEGALVDTYLNHVAGEIGAQWKLLAEPHRISGVYEDEIAVEGNTVGDKAFYAWMLEYGTVHAAPLGLGRRAVMGLGLRFVEHS